MPSLNGQSSCLSVGLKRTVVGEVTALAHESGDDAVEARSLVTEALLAGAQGAEVFSSLGAS